LRNVIDRKFERRLAGLINSGERGVLRGGRKGVEKESLRVTPAGDIVQTRHPAALGAPLTNEHITTDFSESLIELVTRRSARPGNCCSIYAISTNSCIAI
jgi:glutamate--cysteine ligase